MSFNNRSTALIDLLDELNDSDHRYVLVGGYAVSAFNTRFSNDLDLVIAPEQKEAFIEFIEQRGFEKTDSHSKDWVYATEVVEYEKRLAPTQPIGVDLLVNGLGCRQTNAQWSYEYLLSNSHEQTVSGGTSSTTTRVVDGAVLVAAKLHSGRETDLRDVLAISDGIALSEVTPHLHRGDEDELRDQLQQGLAILDSDELRHGFRSDFGESAVSEDTVEDVREYLHGQIEDLS